MVTRPIAPIHPDTIAFERLLGAFEMGQRVSYDALASLVRKTIDKDGDAVKAHIQSAERRLRNAKLMVFGAYHDAETGERGRVRLDDDGIIDKALHMTGSIARRSKRVQHIAACAAPDKLTGDRRVTQQAVMLAARGAQKFTETKGRERFQRLIGNATERIPELDAAWKALLGG